MLKIYTYQSQNKIDNLRFWNHPQISQGSIFPQNAILMKNDTVNTQRYLPENNECNESQYQPSNRQTDANQRNVTQG